MRSQRAVGSGVELGQVLQGLQTSAVPPDLMLHLAETCQFRCVKERPVTSEASSLF